MTGLMHGAVTVSVTCMAQSSICPSCAQLLQNFAPIDAQDEGAAQPNPEPVSRFHFPQVCKRYAEYITEVPASKDEYCLALIRIANKLALSWTNSQFNSSLLRRLLQWTVQLYTSLQKAFILLHVFFFIRKYFIRKLG